MILAFWRALAYKQGETIIRGKVILRGNSNGWTISHESMGLGVGCLSLLGRVQEIRTGR
jgi:hypothetical protein